MSMRMSRKMRVFDVLALAILATSLLTCVSMAGLLVANSSFEDPESNSSGVFPDNGDKEWDYFTGSDWIATSGVAGVLDPTNSSNDPTAPAGTQWGFQTGASAFYQDIGTVDADTTYTVEFWVGDRIGFTTATLTVSLWAGGSQPGDGTSFQLGSQAATLPSTGGGTQWNSLELATHGSDYTGEALYLQFVGTGGGTRQVLIDDVSVIPEPATFGLLGLFALAALLRRKLMGK